MNKGSLPMSGSPRIAKTWRFIQTGDITDMAFSGTNATTPSLGIDGAGGGVLCTNAGADNDSCQFQTDSEFIRFNILNEIYHFEWVAAFNEATQNDVWFGVCTRDTDVIGSKPNDRIGFSKDDGDTYLDVENYMNGTDYGSSANVDTFATTKARYRITVRTGGTAAKGDVYFYKNGVLLKKLFGKTVVDDEELVMSFGVQNGEGSAKTGTVYEMSFDIPNPHL